MEKEPRKASEVLLELEKKLDIALNIIRAQDLSIKILSNKFNSVLEALQKQTAAPPKITVETVNTARHPQFSMVQDPERQIPIMAEDSLPVADSPQGFRRTSRPETFAGDGTYLPNGPPAKQAVEPKFPVQVPSRVPRGPMSPPPGREAETVVQPPTTTKKTATKQVSGSANHIPIEQRVVNDKGKSLFLADVEITDVASLEQIFKTRTNGAGKWMATLPIGNYRVVIRKLEPANKQRLEVSQDIEVDGSTSPMQLQTIIVR